MIVVIITVSIVIIIVIISIVIVGGGGLRCVWSLVVCVSEGRLDDSTRYYACSVYMCVSITDTNLSVDRRRDASSTQHACSAYMCELKHRY